ncbi:XkdF-like putative serine protease domain-containing protein [Bacillus sp. NPDC077027]|uniref:XkdF-like putative serine protease domain-containing protein n=1 Tax=Bacillus sp. NPDC077027 TaxID=3390548 RepID=UPI003D093F25
MPRELLNAKITHVSYVDKAANQKQFFFMKSEGQPDFQKEVRVLTKAEDIQRLVYGVVYEPNTPDAHDDFMSAEEIEKAAHGFMKDARHIDKQHDFQEGVGEVVESYIAPADFKVGGQHIKKGSWVLVTRASKDIWQQIQHGEITGYSMAGTADIIATEADELLSQQSNEKGLFSLLKNFFLKEEATAEVSEQISQDFWTAQDALDSVLFQDERGDEEHVRTALQDFIQIAQEVLKSDDVLTAIGERPVERQTPHHSFMDNQLRELQKAKTAIENVLEKVGEQQEVEVNQDDIQKMLEHAVAPIRDQLTALEKTAGGETTTIKDVLDEKLTPLTERIHVLEKARSISKQTMTDTQNDNKKPVWDGLL